MSAAPGTPEATVSPWVAPTGERMRRLELHITYTCPERCVFCSEDHRMAKFNPFPVTLSRATQVLKEHAAQGVEAVHLTGGEPTVHPDFEAILKVAKALRMRTSMGTIGTGLANPRFAARVMPLLDDVLFSLHGPDAATHDALTRTPGSFDKLLRAVDNARARPGFRPSFNTVVTQANLATLPAVGRLVADRGAGLWILSNTTPEGAGEDHYDALTVRLAELGALSPAIVAAAAPAIVRFFGVPACVLPEETRMCSNDLYWNPRVTVEWAAHPGRVALEGIYSWTPARKRAHAAPCARCSWSTLCPGAFEHYLARHGDAELSPLAPTPEAS